MGIIRAIKSHKLKKAVSKWTDLEVDKNIHIQGTDHDRKRVLTAEDLKFIRKSLKKGLSLKDIASTLYVDVRTIRYRIDPTYRNKRIAQSSGKHYGVTNAAFDNRVSYKRDLVNSGRYLK